jgi:hypothetical protein
VKTASKILAILLVSILLSSTFAFLTYAQTTSVDISLTVTPSATKVVAGTSVSYIYNATNTGEVPLTGNITDAWFGAVGAFVNLAPGGWVGFNVTHVLTQNTSNTATAYGFDQYTNLATDTASVFVEVYSGVDISLTVTPSATKVVAGTSVSYIYNATNTGEVPLTGAIYDDVFGLVGNFVNLQPGGWVAFNITHVITKNTHNVATASGVDQYGNTVTSTASAYVEVCNLWEYFIWCLYIVICYCIFRWCYPFRV